MSGTIYTASDLSTDRSLTPEVCVIGSGAGGAVLAAGLAEAGIKTILLEEGGYHTKSDFDMDEARAYPMLYQDRGTRATADAAITILQGRSVGGGTTVNWTTCFRTPDRILEHWESVHRVEGLSPESLRPHFEAVESRLGIGEWPVELANANNRKLLEGCRAMGWEVESLRRNVRGCANSGFCGVGCPFDAKQGMHLSYIQDGLAAGMDLYANTRATLLETGGGKVTRVHAQVLDPDSDGAGGGRIILTPKVVVVSGGAINSPVLLLKSGINPGGRVGFRTLLHPVVALPAIYDEEIAGFYGAPQSIASHQFSDRGQDKIGFFLEVPPLQPMLAASGLSIFGRGQTEFMRQLSHVGCTIAISIDGLHPQSPGGVVSVRRDGRPKVDYPVGPLLQEAMREAHVQMARLQLAAGAREIYSLHPEQVSIRSESDIAALKAAPYGALQHNIFTAHQMGGCAMGGDPESSVVDPEHRVRGMHNLFVVDGSVFPTALGVNPSETIYAMSHRAREFVGNAI
ncbi:GMC family oxidoreductase [Woeseiaceae bacterium]|nr:GMC family oxidoreductase [Woeseiaceae bacterium]